MCDLKRVDIKQEKSTEGNEKVFDFQTFLRQYQLYAFYIMYLVYVLDNFSLKFEPKDAHTFFFEICYFSTFV